MPTGVYDRAAKAADRASKTCDDCSRTLSVSEFYKNRARSDGLQQNCKTCHRKRNRDWREIELKRKYDMNGADYQMLFEAQNGQCAICGKAPNRTSLAVDHNHDTNEVRGLLCLKCNSGIGLFSDNCEALLKAVAYLRVSRRA